VREPLKGRYSRYSRYMPGKVGRSLQKGLSRNGSLQQIGKR